MNPDHVLTAAIVTVVTALLLGIQAWRGRNEKKAARPIAVVVATVLLMLVFPLLLTVLYFLIPKGAA